MQVNELEFFERLRKIELQLRSAYFDVITLAPKPETREDYQKRLALYEKFVEVVGRNQKELTDLLSLVSENVMNTILTAIYQLFKDDILAILYREVPRIDLVFQTEPTIRSKATAKAKEEE